MRRSTALGLLAIAMVTVAACIPKFPDGATADVSEIGALVFLSWDAAEDPDNVGIDRYQIDVDGIEVATVPATFQRCALTGLSTGQTYEIEVTAFDADEEYSGPGAQGRLSATYTASSNSSGVLGCSVTSDADNDRLPDAAETDDGQFLSATSTGTDPLSADTDDDGLDDGDEALGTVAGLDLPAIGVSPVQQDLLFEVDWFDDSNDCGAHSHRPSAAAEARLVAAFADAPTVNPDGTTGINVVVDSGQGGALTGGNLVPDADGVIASGVSGSDFKGIKAAHFAANREGYFHYTLMPHRYNTTSNSSGQAEINGDDMIVSLYCAGSDNNVANTFMHEVGHNLGLRHSGDTNSPNYEPNYNSVMNYRYQFPGVDTNCTPAGDGKLDYSTGDRATLDENALMEADGICGGVALDWNGNSVLDPGPVAVDINNNDLVLGLLTDHDDWGAINLAAINDLDGASLHDHDHPEIVSEQPVPAPFN